MTTTKVKRLALDAGFDRVGIATAHARPDDKLHFDEWLAAGMHGDMHWLARDVARRCDPDLVVSGARSVVCLALDYDSEAPRSSSDGAIGDGHGWISRYAWGDDYHRVIEPRLRALSHAVQREIVPDLRADWRGRDVAPAPWNPRLDFRYYVDHGPVLERQWAAEAGLGWQGRHSLLVDPERGSFFFLAVIVTSLRLIADRPVADHCGSCTACVDACPTDAITVNRGVDARRCISYLTIEAPVPLGERDEKRLHGHVFGCDICQDVCPFNRFSRPAPRAEFQPRDGLVFPRLIELADISDAAFASRFRHSPVRRRKAAAFREIVRAVAASQADAQGVTGSDPPVDSP